jgi:hypothetical protein
MPFSHHETDRLPRQALEKPKRKLETKTLAFCSDADPAPAGLRDENDAWGWDWSPNLDPISIWKGPVRIVAPDHAAMPHLASWSPKITVSPRQRHARKWRYRS